MKKFLRIFLLILLVLGLIYLGGPNPRDPIYRQNLPEISASGAALDSFIAAEESVHPVKPDNEARIIWMDSSRQATPYAVVYLHGFSASQEEGDPVHRHFAERFGTNLFLSRLAFHGLDTLDAMVQLSPEAYWESAQRALAIGRQIGTRIILMATSTGGTQALQLAAAYPDQVAALILLSPNIEINDPNAHLLNNPWGLQLARLVKGGNDIITSDQRDIYKRYWYAQYRLESTVALQEMLETTMVPETFRKVTQPVLLLYYYQDEAHQDPVVRVSAMKRMFGQLGTPDALKREVPIPGAGDHVIGSYIKSKDLDAVERAVTSFAEEVLGLRPR